MADDLSPIGYPWGPEPLDPERPGRRVARRLSPRLDKAPDEVNRVTLAELNRISMEAAQSATKRMFVDCEAYNNTGNGGFTVTNNSSSSPTVWIDQPQANGWIDNVPAWDPMRGEAMDQLLRQTQQAQPAPPPKPEPAPAPENLSKHGRMIFRPEK